MDQPTAKRILVVDDDKAIAEAVQYLLEDAGYEVVVSTDVADALLKSSDGEYAAAVLDAAMGAGTLCVVADCLRTGASTSHIPIVILSGLAEDVVRAEFERYDIFVRKDEDLSNFVTRIDALIGDAATTPKQS